MNDQDFGLVHIYPVGILRDIKNSWRRRRLLIWKWRLHLRSSIFKPLMARDWHRLKGTFNGYLAEPDVLPPALARCGSGWTRKRALRDLQTRVRKAQDADIDPQYLEGEEPKETPVVSRTFELTSYKSHDGFVKVGEISVDENGLISGTVFKSELDGLPDRIVKSTQEVMFTMLFVPDVPDDDSK